MSCRCNLLNIQPPILPFLLETRTLHLRPFRIPHTRSFSKPFRRHFSTTKCSLVDLEDRDIDDHVPLEPPTRSYSLDNVKSFHIRPTKFKSKTWLPPTRSRPDEQAFRFGLNQSDPSSPRFQAPYDSTITASEQAVFDRIFADISSSSETVRKDKAQDDDESFAGLDTIFNNATEEVRKRTEHNEPREAIPILSVYSVKLKEKADWRQPGKIGSDDVSNLAAAHAQYRHKLDVMLEKAQTDVEIWQILENEVFSLIHELHARIKEAEKATKAEKRLRKGTKPPTKVTSPPPSPSGGDEETMQKPAIRENPRIRHRLRPASFPPTALLSVLQTEYPKYLSKALGILRNSFPTSLFALNILPAVRRLGPISYVLGASTALYNETMFLVWKQEGNLHAMAKMLDEMRKGGVESDSVTLSFLAGLGRVRSIELAEYSGEWRGMWWRMASQEEAWQQIAQATERCREEVRAKEAAHAAGGDVAG